MKHITSRDVSTKLRDFLKCNTYNDKKSILVDCVYNTPFHVFHNYAKKKPFTYRGIVYLSIEQAYHAQKFESRPSIQRLVSRLDYDSLGRWMSKMTTRAVFDKRAWSLRCLFALYEITKVYYAANKEEVDAIWATRGRKKLVIKNGQSKNRFWHATVFEGKNHHQGANVVGKIWHLVLEPENFSELIAEINELGRKTELTPWKRKPTIRRAPPGGWPPMPKRFPHIVYHPTPKVPEAPPEPVYKWVMPGKNKRPSGPVVKPKLPAPVKQGACIEPVTHKEPSVESTPNKRKVVPLKGSK
jgi:hypothetical protein